MASAPSAPIFILSAIINDLTDVQDCELVEVVADQDDAEQAVGAVEQQLRAAGRDVALAHQVAQAQPVDRHHRGLGYGKEGRDQQ